MMLAHLDDVKLDWLKFGTMLVVSHLYVGGNLQDQAWMMATLYTLLGFTVYQLVTRDLVPTQVFGLGGGALGSDTVKFGTMLIVSRLLSGQELDGVWATTVVVTLVGFALYHLLTARAVQGQNISSDSNISSAIDDVAMFGTMLVFSQLYLSGFNVGSLADSNWQQTTIAVLLGLVVYDMGIARFVQ